METASLRMIAEMIPRAASVSKIGFSNWDVIPMKQIPTTNTFVEVILQLHQEVKLLKCTWILRVPNLVSKRQVILELARPQIVQRIPSDYSSETIANPKV
jgi:hypothetical protein